MSHSDRRAAGSSPVVGSSRKTSSGSLTRARAIDEPLTLAARQDLGLRVPPFAELEQVDQLVRRTWVRIEAPEQVDDLDHGQLRVERRGLEADADAWLERVGAVGDVEAEDDRLAAIGRAQTLEDLDRRRLAGAVRPEQAEDLARARRRNRCRRRPGCRRSA